MPISNTLSNTFSNTLSDTFSNTLSNTSSNTFSDTFSDTLSMSSDYGHLIRTFEPERVHNTTCEPHVLDKTYG